MPAVLVRLCLETIGTTCNQGIQLISSHIFREGNYCVELIANMGHSHQGTVWLSMLPQTLQTDFFRDRYGMPDYSFP
jgi:hypothetical protein